MLPLLLLLLLKEIQLWREKRRKTISWAPRDIAADLIFRSADAVKQASPLTAQRWGGGVGGGEPKSSMCFSWS